MSLGPAQVHPQEHLRPVGRLGAARTGGDREHRVLRVVLAGEEQEGPLASEELAQVVGLALDLLLDLGVGRVLEQRQELEDVVYALLDAPPEVDLVPQALGLAEDRLSRTLVLPEPGFAASCVERRQAGLLGPEVKDAPTSTESAPPGPGWMRDPSVTDPEILEQDRTELDQSEGRLAPCDDGVHAGTVAVVGADAAVAITVERSGVAAVPTVPLAGDQVNETRFLGLLHKSLSQHTMGTAGGATGAVGWRGGPDAWEVLPSIGANALIAKRESCGFRRNVVHPGRESGGPHGEDASWSSMTTCPPPTK